MKYKVEQRTFGNVIQTVETQSFSLAKKWYRSFYDTTNCVALLWINDERIKIPEADEMMGVIPERKAFSIVGFCVKKIVEQDIS